MTGLKRKRILSDDGDTRRSTPRQLFGSIEAPDTDSFSPAARKREHHRLQWYHNHYHNFPPDVYDQLSTIKLTPRALRELDRRNGGVKSNHRPTTPEYSPLTSAIIGSDLPRFARQGGPDLCELRGFPEVCVQLHTMSSRRSKSTKTPGLSHAAETAQEPIVRKVDSKFATEKSRRSSAYDGNFENVLNRHGIFLPLQRSKDNRAAPSPENLPDIRQALGVARPSLSPSQFDDEDFEEFLQQNVDAQAEGSVMRTVIPILTGKATHIRSDGPFPFRNMASMTDDQTVDPAPDMFDGVRIIDVHPKIYDDLSELIVPSDQGRRPIVPNFFLEGKPASGSMPVVGRQACHDGAYGARAQCSLRSYGIDGDPLYDNNAYSHSATYQDGLLRLYAHHARLPASAAQTQPGSSHTVGPVQPEYHMTRVGGCDITADRDTFVKGVGALRNLRDLAKRDRDESIAIAEQALLRQLATRTTHGLDPEADTVNKPINVDCVNPLVDGIESDVDDGNTSSGEEEFIDAEEALFHEIEQASIPAIGDDGLLTSFTSAEPFPQVPLGVGAQEISGKRRRKAHDPPSGRQTRQRAGESETPTIATRKEKNIDNSAPSQLLPRKDTRMRRSRRARE